ncbi:SDR family oxidoreductase [Nocardioides sp. CFH 31398]|uniref:SDR family oxidoreductase n=1 Tax=Nocardioides sp. CFH 31398 TaxID=2919579 RepID=UPI001F055B21|nr:NmrA family NAD(P)-binding protein [Nocardioides sp. CFH 31398]MCH1867984.1 NmrA family NAD(P)-binding protein [Nocardioides sp. CFH 31398]
MTVLVTGATGTVGTEVVRALRERGAAVRAMSRTPESAGMPAGVEVVRGDLTDLASLRAALDGVEAAHLITFDAPRGAGGGEAVADGTGVVAALTDAGVRRVTVLQNGYPGPVEEAVADAPFEATVLMPVEFMANALDWADAVREHGRVDEPYVDRLSAMVHEADIGDVAAVALLEDGHGGPLVITGPEVLTLRDKLDAIGEAVGRRVDLVALSEDEAIERWRAEGLDDEAIGFRQWIYGDPPEVGYTVATTVPDVTGRPGRTFAQWAREHAAAFGG